MTGLSIITVHKEDIEGLRVTLNSLERFLEIPQCEWIVIDANSDFTDEESKKFLNHVARSCTKFVSEADEGIYDGMNKGISLSNHAYLLFLNCGDQLHPNFEIETLVSMCLHSHPDMIWASYDETGRKESLSAIQPRSSRWIYWGMPTSHQAIFFKRDMLKNSGYDLDFALAADYDMVARFVRQGATISCTNQPVAIVDGQGKSRKQLKRAFREQAQVRTRYFGTSWLLNWVIAGMKLAIGQIGKFPALRKLWK